MRFKWDPMNTEAEPQEIIIEVTEEEYQAELARGLRDDEVLRPGSHAFKRGGFLARHNLKPDPLGARPKVRISLDLDLDVVNYFKQRAIQVDAPSYETQINDALRDVMEHEKNGSSQD